VIISLGFELPRTSSDLPEDLGRASRSAWSQAINAGVFLFGLASGDAYRAGDVTTTAVGSYSTVSPLPDPQRLDWGPIALAIGGLFSVVPVSDRSAWVLPSALPLKSGLSSRSVAATSDHPVFFNAHDQYRKGSKRLQGQVTSRTTKEGVTLPTLRASFSVHSTCTIPPPIVSVASQIVSTGIDPPGKIE
jgi:hypothetical protein